MVDPKSQSPAPQVTSHSGTPSPHFDPSPVDRTGTHSFKWEFQDQNPDLAPVLPLWVADMDFAIPAPITQALMARSQHPIFGYTMSPKEYFLAIADWQWRRHGRKVDPKHLLLAPTVMHALSMMLREWTEPGDAILNLSPVYGPFGKCIETNKRRLIQIPLLPPSQAWQCSPEDGEPNTATTSTQDPDPDPKPAKIQFSTHPESFYRLDLEAIETQLQAQVAAAQPIKALFFCNPQNPTGRAWTQVELQSLLELAQRYDFLIFSDEIHGDLCQGTSRGGADFVSFLDLPGAEERTIVLAGASKTFNIAGLGLCYAHIPYGNLRRRMHLALQADFFDAPNALSLCAHWAAYAPQNQCEIWLDGLLDLIQSHEAILRRWLAQLSKDLGCPALSTSPLEATYLQWVDIQALWSILPPQLQSTQALGDFLEKTARVKVGPAHLFCPLSTDPEHCHHLRFNLAIATPLFQSALARIRQALLDL